MASAEWRLTLSRAGTILGATDGTPDSWLGRRPDDRNDDLEESP
jgi:hypothetical protein